jgi:coenzyme F420-dependent glucose-6-phosphate dehydrogenase
MTYLNQIKRNAIKSLHLESQVNEKTELNSKLYTKPTESIPLYVSGLGEQSAKLAGEEADGFVTNELDIERIKNKLFPALEKGTRISGKDYESMNKILFIPASYSEDKESALQSIRFWRGAMIKAFFDVDVHDPRKIQENGQVIGDDSLDKMLLVITSAEEAINKLKKYIDVGFTEIVLTNSSPNREDLVKLMAEKITPYVNNR